MNKILCINAGGIGDLHGLRMRRLTKGLDASLTLVDLDKSQSRLANGQSLWTLLRSDSWDLVYLESTGIAAGLPLIAAAQTWGQPFIVSSGDPVSGYFKTVQGPVAGHLFGTYERLLYRSCVGFVGWTPYLTGRALHLGAPRGVTIEGAADLDLFTPASPAARRALRHDLGLPDDHIVCGVVGSLTWTDRQQYCYGLELVKMLPYLRRSDVSILIVGDGSGRAQLEAAVPPALRDRVVFTGRVPEEKVVGMLNSMDIGFITQTLDQLGSYRLTTKLPEYLATGLPVAMSPIPGFYDYVTDCGWALPAAHPASPVFHEACAAWLDQLSRADIEAKARAARPTAETRFDYAPLTRRFQRFLGDVLPSSSRPRPSHEPVPA